MDGFLAGVDIGGIFTDCIVVSDDGEAVTAKAPFSPAYHIEGAVGGPSLTAANIGPSLPELWSRLR